MSKVLTLNFSNYMVAAVLAISTLSGCVEFYSSPVGLGDGSGPSKSARPAERAPTPEEIVQNPERYKDKIYWGNNCEVLKLQLNEKTMQAENVQQDLTISRTYQRVVRKNCAGDVVSDKTEKFEGSREDFALSIPGQKAVQSFFIYNDETCAHKLTTMDASRGILPGLLYPVANDGKYKIHVKGDMAEALLTFHMREGMNNIYVKYFYDCSPEDVLGNIHTIMGGRNCKESRDSLIVQYPVSVTYVTKTVDEVLEVNPSVEQCNEQAKSGK